ncbi:MAG TPA: hypothetical protein VF277_06155 [Steroidobacteraceae bacterium]
MPNTRLSSLVIAATLFVSTAAVGDIVTGSVAPAGAKVVVVDTAGKEVARLTAGPFQLQLPVGKYTARCEAPATHQQTFLSLSDPVTVNIVCN